MLDIILQVKDVFLEKSVLELLAVILAIAYLALVIRESIWCWPCAFISTMIYIGLFWHVSLMMESLLNVYYLIMAVYGFWLWKRGNHKLNNKPIITWSISYHVGAIAAVLIASYISGTFLSYYSQAAWPYLDSFTTWAAILTTFMVAQKVIENWIYWFIIDGLSIFLYWDKQLYFTVVLFVVYLVMVVIGFFVWRKALAKQSFVGALSP